MKKITKLLTALFAICFLLSFSACQWGDRTVEESGVVTVVIMNEAPLVFKLQLDEIDLSQGALSLMLYLKEKEGLTVEYEEGQLGAYFTRIGDIMSDDNGYLSIFTSHEKDWDVTEYCITKDYNGITVKTSAVGISSMSVLDGMVLYFAYVNLSY